MKYKEKGDREDRRQKEKNKRRTGNKVRRLKEKN